MLLTATLRSDDTYGPDCDGDHSYSIVNEYSGAECWVNGPCDCDVVQVGIVNGRARFSVRTTSSEYDDLPF